MQKPFTLQKDYTLFNENYQLVLPLDLGYIIPADDSVRLLSQFIERMFLGDLYRTYRREVRGNEPTPRQLLKLLIYAYMNHIYSSRAIENACRRDINFMWLLEGTNVPDHATIARFRSLHFAPCTERVMAEVSEFLYQLGELSGETIFIDGTKIEADANKYTFVWKKSVTKNMEKLLLKIAALVQECEALYGVDSEYIVWLTIGSQPTDTTTLIPFLKEMEEFLKKNVSRGITAKSRWRNEQKRCMYRRSLINTEKPVWNGS